MKMIDKEINGNSYLTIIIHIKLLKNNRETSIIIKTLIKIIKLFIKLIN